LSKPETRPERDGQWRLFGYRGRAIGRLKTSSNGQLFDVSVGESARASVGSSDVDARLEHTCAGGPAGDLAGRRSSRRTPLQAGPAIKGPERASSAVWRP